MQEILNFITNNGFAIVMCLLLYTELRNQNEKHKEEVASLSKAIENNTEAITKLTIYIQEKE